MFNPFKHKAATRKNAEPPEAVAEKKPELPEIQAACLIRDCFIFRDVLFGRGSVERVGGADLASGEAVGRQHPSCPTWATISIPRVCEVDPVRWTADRLN